MLPSWSQGEQGISFGAQRLAASLAEAPTHAKLDAPGSWQNCKLRHTEVFVFLLWECQACRNHVLQRFLTLFHLATLFGGTLSSREGLSMPFKLN